MHLLISRNRFIVYQGGWKRSEGFFIYVWCFVLGFFPLSWNLTAFLSLNKCIIVPIYHSTRSIHQPARKGRSGKDTNAGLALDSLKP